MADLINAAHSSQRTTVSLTAVITGLVSNGKMNKVILISLWYIFIYNFGRSVAMQVRQKQVRPGIFYPLRPTRRLPPLPLFVPDIPKTGLNLDKDPAQSAEIYDFYVPDSQSHLADSETQLYLALTPPKLSNEPNYYSLKRKKVPKKYSADGNHIIYKPVYESASEEIDALTQYTPPPKISAADYKNITYNIGEIPPEKSEEEEEEEVTVEPKPDRVEYQVHGHDGPKSYKFGYDTGTGQDRQFRYEVRDKDGRVEGEYGYLDKGGKLIKVKYTSTAEEGFKIETEKNK